MYHSFEHNCELCGTWRPFSACHYRFAGRPGDILALVSLEGASNFLQNALININFRRIAPKFGEKSPPPNAAYTLLNTETISRPVSVRSSHVSYRLYPPPKYRATHAIDLVCQRNATNNLLPGRLDRSLGGDVITEMMYDRQRARISASSPPSIN